MFLFLVRHGFSEDSEKQWQTPNSKLSRIGKNQAEILSTRSRFSSLDSIFTSKWERSYQTAETIARNLKIKTKTLDYINEREQLSQIYGARRESEISKKYIKEYYANYRNLDWKFENKNEKEESVREVINRAGKLSKFLLGKYKNKRVLVVSHDIFIRCFIGLAMLGSSYSDKAMISFITKLSINHAGISLLIYNSQTKSWNINYINDYSHLSLVARKD